MKSLDARLARLERIAEQQLAGETVVKVLLVIVSTRAEVLALDRLRHSEPPADPPQTQGRIRLELLPSISAREYLAKNGIVLPENT